MSSKSTSSSSSSSTSSSSDSSSDIEETFKKLDLKEETEINILLLGETGVGKSTFINSLANYLSIKYFIDVEKKGLVKLIPTVYKICDKDNKEHEIKLGPQKDKNECLKIGESATQNVKTYVFPIWKGKSKVRLIDTPGMGDTRGVEQDEKNCENIISYIKKLEKIHAVCFLCKPTNARKTVYFDYCIYQILSHLESEAAKNIFFLFTNTRGSNYGPGDTFLTLKAIIKNVEDNTGVQIPLEKHNMYYFDNEAFRFLGACENNVQFDQSTRKICSDSWEHSAKECWEFVKHLHHYVVPYEPSKLLDVNFAKRTLFQVCKVLVNITERMTDTKCIMDKMEVNKKKHLETILELKKGKTSITDVIVQEWSQPILVCTSIPSCAQIYRIKGEHKTHYKNVCHYCFDLDKNRIQMFITGSADITKCEEIDYINRKCRKCGCDFLLHMHTDYTTSLQESLMVDDDAATEIAIKESLLSESKDISRDLQIEIDRYKEEYDEIKKLCLDLSRYLKEHSIVVFSVSYKSYIEYLINQQQSSGSSSVSTSIDDLRKLKDEYEVAQRAFEEYLKSPVSSTEKFNFDMKDEYFQNFFKLQRFGSKLKEEYMSQKKSAFAFADFDVEEYVHDQYYIKEHDIKRNKRSRRPNDNDNRGRSQRNRGNNRNPYDGQHSNYQQPFGHPPEPYGNYASQQYPPNYNYTGQNPSQPYGQYPSQSYGQHPSQSYGPYLGHHPPPLLGQHPPPLLGQHPPAGYPQEATGYYGHAPNYMHPYAGPSHGTHQQGQQDTNSNDGNRTNFRDRRYYQNKSNRGRGRGNYGNHNKEDKSDSDDSQHSSVYRGSDGNRKKDGNNRGRRNYGNKNKDGNRDSDESRNSSVDRRNDGNRNKDGNYRGNRRGRRNFGKNKDGNRDSDESRNSSVDLRNDGNRNKVGNYRGNHRGRRNFGKNKDGNRGSDESRNSSVDRRNDGNRNKGGTYRGNTRGRGNYGDRSRNRSVDRNKDDNRNKEDNRDIDGSEFYFVNKDNGGNRNRGGNYRGNFRGRGNCGDRSNQSNYGNRGRGNDINQTNSGGMTNCTDIIQSHAIDLMGDVVKYLMNDGDPPGGIHSNNPSNRGGTRGNTTSNRGGIRGNNPSNRGGTMNNNPSSRGGIINNNPSNPVGVRNFNTRAVRHTGNPTTFSKKDSKKDNEACNVM